MHPGQLAWSNRSVHRYAQVPILDIRHAIAPIVHPRCLLHPLRPLLPHHLLLALLLLLLLTNSLLVWIDRHICLVLCNPRLADVGLDPHIGKPGQPLLMSGLPLSTCDLLRSWMRVTRSVLRHSFPLIRAKPSRIPIHRELLEGYSQLFGLCGRASIRDPRSVLRVPWPTQPWNFLSYSTQNGRGIRGATESDPGAYSSVGPGGPASRPTSSSLTIERGPADVKPSDGSCGGSGIMFMSRSTSSSLTTGPAGCMRPVNIMLFMEYELIPRGAKIGCGSKMGRLEVSASGRSCDCV
ncbi:hypothetical protein BCR34DRAFT_102176 [Clohesyomyces aquaticus]|uniref:Uncharacterized protein n=1 Tax=Clohesyomyces aquaticus TaxID=1231657 RepID=A0A1Y1YSI9_9PLEO|nr:hypothetical protein BCR34DRAFT_102176 [Clohesyomyces aquaticus]